MTALYKRRAILLFLHLFTDKEKYTYLIGAEGTETPRKCLRIFFVRGQTQGSPFSVLREYMAGEIPQAFARRRKKGGSTLVSPDKRWATKTAASCGNVATRSCPSKGLERKTTGCLTRIRKEAVPKVILLGQPLPDLYPLTTVPPLTCIVWPLTYAESSLAR